MPRITLITAAALAALALFAPAATAIPVRYAGTTTAAPQQDLRGADARDASMPRQTVTAAGPRQLRTPDAVDAGTKPAEPVPGLPARPLDPEPIVPAPADVTPASGGDASRRWPTSCPASRSACCSPPVSSTPCACPAAPAAPASAPEHCVGSGAPPGTRRSRSRPKICFPYRAAVSACREQTGNPELPH
jgi:hypothetical protein